MWSRACSCPRESLLQDRRYTHLTSTRHVSCTHLTRTWRGERTWQASLKYVSRNCLDTTFLLLPVILNLRQAQGDRKGNALSSYTSLAGWRRIYNRRVHAENHGHAKTLLRAFACGLRGKNTARAPWVCLAILPFFARRQHVEARTVGCKKASR
jgi:hypothetical protein